MHFRVRIYAFPNASEKFRTIPKWKSVLFRLGPIDKSRLYNQTFRIARSYAQNYAISTTFCSRKSLAPWFFQRRKRTAIIGWKFLFLLMQKQLPKIKSCDLRIWIQQKSRKPGSFTEVYGEFLGAKNGAAVRWNVSFREIFFAGLFCCCLN